MVTLHGDRWEKGTLESTSGSYMVGHLRSPLYRDPVQMGEEGGGRDHWMTKRKLNCPAVAGSESRVKGDIIFMKVVTSLSYRWRISPRQSVLKGFPLRPSFPVSPSKKKERICPQVIPPPGSWNRFHSVRTPGDASLLRVTRAENIHVTPNLKLLFCFLVNNLKSLIRYRKYLRS